MTPTPIDPWERLAAGAAALGAPLTSDQMAAFQRYTALLIETNRHVNLTAVRDLESIIPKLHLDSLSLLAPIAAAAGLPVAALRSQPWRAVDVGSGAGIPGLPLLFAWPPLRLTLIESVQKKARFLTEVIFLLSEQAEVLAERAEVVGQGAAWRQQYDLVLARAVAPLPTLVELTLPLARVGGLAALPKGLGLHEELAQAGAAIALLGGEVAAVHDLLIPGVVEQRTLLLLRKVRPTPAAYPRRAGLPAKSPLAS